eukprot:288940-Chlamydomonas_euryale.AAC.3
MPLRSAAPQSSRSLADALVRHGPIDGSGADGVAERPPLPSASSEPLSGRMRYVYVCAHMGTHGQGEGGWRFCST